MAFVMPLCVTDSDLYFRRAEAASLVEILGAEAKQLVVCVVADRFADADRDQAHLRQFYPVPLAKPTEKIHLVVSGNVKTSISQERLRDNFAGKGMKMTWIPSPDRSSDP